MRKEKISILLNSIIILLVLLGAIFMFFNIKFMGEDELLTSSNISLLQFFTVDSNIFIGIASIIYLIKREKSTLIKSMATTSVVLTFIVTACFLVPTSKYTIFAFYKNSNLFFHFIIPILSVVTYCNFDSLESLKKKNYYLNLLPVLCYAIFYSWNALSHIENNKVPLEYDFYGFLRGGIHSTGLVLILNFGLTFLIGWVINHIQKVNSNVND